MDKITVSAQALREILQALSGPGHLIRELQVIRSLGDNPIDTLIQEYNDALKTSQQMQQYRSMANNDRHPIQPLREDAEGVVRFKQNSIVRYLADQCNMNDLANMNWSDEDRQQFAQLLGYSLGGYAELSYVTEAAFGAAELMRRDGLTPDAARVSWLEQHLKSIRDGLRTPVAELFGIHPDDLKQQ